MIAWLRRANREQWKLLLSLGTNFLTRVPGAIGILWFLPLLRFGLGTADYASLLTSMALGSAAAFLCGGFSLVGRRLIGQAYSLGNRAGEADAFVSLFVANGTALGLALVVIAAFCWARSADSAVLVVSTFPAFALFLNTFDNVRSAYNEHYVTATLLIIFQSTIYAIGFFLPATRHSLVLGALVLQSPYILASVITFALLLHDKPYLTGGRPAAVWCVIRQGTILSMADGFLMATVSLSVVWLQATASATTSAWFATIVRLFQTFLVPVILVLVPLSSYIRILWNSKSVAQRQGLAKATLLIGLSYGALIAVVLFIASRVYVGFLLQLPEPEGGLWQILPSFLLFGAIIAYKSYSSVAYLVLDEPMHLSTWTTVSVSMAVALAAVASYAVSPFGTVNVYALVTGLSITVVLFWNAVRFIRLSQHTSISGQINSYQAAKSTPKQNGIQVGTDRKEATQVAAEQPVSLIVQRPDSEEEDPTLGPRNCVARTLIKSGDAFLCSGKNSSRKMQR
jgi:hypothetical protein